MGREELRTGILKSAKGQVAIFVVLIFQVLFILFAMTINIAMVAYDKINFQNSLDLAAYYGAKKQAEVLNAMAHINYQMRQNWKLLAWRYRILGTLIQPNGGTAPDYWCPQNSVAKYNTTTNDNCRVNSSLPISFQNQCQNAQSIFSGTQVYGNGYCDLYYFICISQELWKRGIKRENQNFCNKKEVSIQPITSLPIVAGFMEEAHLGASGVQDLKDRVGKSCPTEGALNWLMTQFFMTHFRLDQKDRKVMIEEIYNQTLKVGKDLDGASLFKGSAKVFCGNLSRANKENAKELCSSYSKDKGLKYFNSFEGKEFKNLFGKLNVWPVLQFLYTEKKDTSFRTCPMKTGLHLRTKKLITKNPSPNIFKDVKAILKSSSHSLFGSLTDEVEKLFAFNSRINFLRIHKDPIRDLTLAFFKKKDQTLYYGLKAEFDYESKNQVFSLNLSEPIKFKASAFAKPFGSSFGPQPEQNDPLIPVHRVPNHPSQSPSLIPNSNQINSVLLQPNHSRFPGDKWGLIDRRMHDNRGNINFLNKQRSYKAPIQRVYTMEDYFHLNLYPGKADDPLARRDPRSYPHDPNTFTRMMELMAVYPDLYDISYYSVLGNYHQTYFKKICKLLKGSECDPKDRNEFKSPAAQTRTVYIRGDFGWPDTDEYIKSNQRYKNKELSIAPYFLNTGNQSVNKNIINPPVKPPAESPAKLWGKNYPPRREPNYPLSQGNLFYAWLANPLPDQLLSSWTNPHPLIYEEYTFPDKPSNNFPEGRFLKCPYPAKENMPVPSACAAGGRSGYSVKLLSCEIVKDLKPKPSNLDEYCPN